MPRTIRYRHPVTRKTSGEPLSAMNITPLIDVMLVLLVMLILTLPITLHKVDIPLPQPGRVDYEPMIQKIVLTNDGTTYWNGIATDETEMGSKLRALAASSDELQIQVEANARYERFDQLIALVRKSGVTKLGFVGNSQFRDWSKQERN